MATVVVTGSSGAIGRATVDAFAGAGFEVVGLDRVAAQEVDGVRHTTVDLGDEDAVAATPEDIGLYNTW